MVEAGTRTEISGLPLGRPLLGSTASSPSSWAWAWGLVSCLHVKFHSSSQGKPDIIRQTSMTTSQMIGPYDLGKQHFSNFNVPMNHVGILLKCRPWGSAWDEKPGALCNAVNIRPWHQRPLSSKPFRDTGYPAASVPWFSSAFITLGD